MMNFDVGEVSPPAATLWAAPLSSGGTPQRPGDHHGERDTGYRPCPAFRPPEEEDATNAGFILAPAFSAERLTGLSGLRPPMGVSPSFTMLQPGRFPTPFGYFHPSLLTGLQSRAEIPAH